MILQANLGAPQTGVGYRFYDSAGLLGSGAITTGYTNPTTGVYVVEATPPTGTIGVEWSCAAGIVAREGLTERLRIETALPNIGPGQQGGLPQLESLGGRFGVYVAQNNDKTGYALSSDGRTQIAQTLADYTISDLALGAIDDEDTTLLGFWVNAKRYAGIALNNALAAKLSADAAARPGAAMSVSADGLAGIRADLERAGGLLALINMGVNWLTSMHELVAGGVRRWKASALSQTPLGDGQTGENLNALNVTVGNLQLTMNRIAGLVGENQISRDFVYDGAGTILSFAIRSYDTAAHAEIDDGETGLLGEYSVTNTLSQDGLVEVTTTTLNA